MSGSKKRMTPKLLEGKLGVVFGVASNRSIAWAIAQAWHDAGAKLAFTYQGERIKENVEELVATFGTVLHISGRDGPQLEASLRRFADGHALKMAAVPVSLEDVFIHLMQGSEDPFRG